MERLCNLVVLLLDGEWHAYQELEEKTRMTRLQLGTLLRLLSEFGMADMDDGAGRCRLEPLTRSVWAEVAEGERA